RQAGVVDRLDDALHVLLADAVKLKPLARGDPQRAVSPARGDLVFKEVLLGGQAPAGDFRPHHENPGLVLSRALERRPLIPVILLIRSVMLQKRNVPLFVMRNRGGEILLNRSRKPVALLFITL